MRPHGPCGKKIYRSERDARKDIRMMQRYNLREAEKLNAFICRDCRAWHVGHAHEMRR